MMNTCYFLLGLFIGMNFGFFGTVFIIWKGFNSKKNENKTE